MDIKLEFYVPFKKENHTLNFMYQVLHIDIKKCFEYLKCVNHRSKALNSFYTN